MGLVSRIVLAGAAEQGATVLAMFYRIFLAGHPLGGCPPRFFFHDRLAFTAP